MFGDLYMIGLECKFKVSYVIVIVVNLLYVFWVNIINEKYFRDGGME